MIPTHAQADRRLRQILARGSANLGEGPDAERLMLMVTRDCALRCAYCFVDKTEHGPVMPLSRAQQGVDLMMQSGRTSLEIQFFGGEPSNAFDVVQGTVRYAQEHPERRARPLRITLTSHGLNLDAERVAWLDAHDVSVLFSLDGDADAHARYRKGPGRESQHDTALQTLELLKNSGIDWFMNVVLPPAAAGELEARYHWALEHDVPALQLNYAVGMKWSEAAEATYLRGLRTVLLHHARTQPELLLYNWRSDAEPVMLSDDLIVDVDGTLLHDGAIFLEKAMPELRRTYLRGHLDTTEAFDPLRWNLATLCKVMVGTWPEGHRLRDVAIQNIRMGAAVDLLVQVVAREVGR